MQWKEDSTLNSIKKAKPNELLTNWMSPSLTTHEQRSDFCYTHSYIILWDRGSKKDEERGRVDLIFVPSNQPSTCQMSCKEEASQGTTISSSFLYEVSLRY